MFQACNVDDLVGLNFDEIKELGSFYGDLNFYTVIVHAQGGPSATLNDQGLIDLIVDVTTEQIIVANILQRQHQDPRLLQEQILNPEEALQIDLGSVDDLDEVI